MILNKLVDQVIDLFSDLGIEYCTYNVLLTKIFEQYF